MNEKKNNTQSGGMTLTDVYFVLFRNKWKITILSTLGIVAAGGIYLFKPPAYQSEADLFIKYVKRETPTGAAGIDSNVQGIESGVNGLISTEVAILNSFDLAMEVATNIGPSKILGTVGGPNDATAANAAANKIRDSLIVDRFPSSTVLRVVFTHSDLSQVQPILQQVIDVYQARHKQIHGITLSYETLVKEVDDLHDQMKLTEEELRKAKAEVNVNNLDKRKDDYESSLTQLGQTITIINADLAEKTATLESMKAAAAKETVTAATPTNTVTTNAGTAVPKEKTERYQQTLELISDLRKEYINLRSIYPLHNSLVVEKQTQIDEQVKNKKNMEADEPRLAATAEAKGSGYVSSTGGTGIGAEEALKQQQTMVNSLMAKLNVLKTSYATQYTASTNLDAKEFAIRDLESKLKDQTQHWSYFRAKLSELEIDTNLGAIKDANISVTQKPTPPTREMRKTPKMMGIVAGGGVMLGLAWAFLLELYFDHSVKRPKDIEADLGMRLFLSIPDTRRNGHRRKAAKAAARPKNLPEAGPVVPANGATNGDDNGEGHLEIAPWDHSHSLHQYYEALRDRLISYFEVNNLNHKPKLVAVTGSSQGSGTTTIAAGLAASLSETGDGNVLLIDMNLEQGAAQHFYKGKPNCELDTALEGNTMEKAMIQDNLYVVAGRTNNGDKLSSMLPKRFANLIPRLKASDYDYIIFDMPPISRTGVTQRLAGFMDMMMLVVEAEKTNREVVRQANALLTESKAKVSVVLNKTRSYIPASLHQEF